MSLFKRHFAATFVGFLTALDTRADSKEGSVQASSCLSLMAFSMMKGTSLRQQRQRAGQHRQQYTSFRTERGRQCRGTCRMSLVKSAFGVWHNEQPNRIDMGVSVLPHPG